MFCGCGEGVDRGSGSGHHVTAEFGLFLRLLLAPFLWALRGSKAEGLSLRMQSSKMKVSAELNSFCGCPHNIALSFGLH